jgi:hypothetical protein
VDRLVRSINPVKFYTGVAIIGACFAAGYATYLYCRADEKRAVEESENDDSENDKNKNQEVTYEQA